MQIFDDFSDWLESSIGNDYNSWDNVIWIKSSVSRTRSFIYIIDWYIISRFSTLSFIFWWLYVAYQALKWHGCSWFETWFHNSSHSAFLWLSNSTDVFYQTGSLVFTILAHKVLIRFMSSSLLGQSSIFRFSSPANHYRTVLAVWTDTMGLGEKGNFPFTWGGRKILYKTLWYICILNLPSD